MVAFNSSRPGSNAALLGPARTAQLAASRVEAQHDAILVKRFATGDEAAFVEIVARYHDKLLAVAFDRLRNHADAEEIAADAFIRAHRGLVNFRGDSSLSTWLHRITMNLASNRYWYFFRRRRHLTQSMDLPLSENGPATLSDLVASPAPGPIRNEISREFVELIALCTSRLSAAQKEVLRLRNDLNSTYEEIAATLGIEVGTVKSRLARARGRLQELMLDACPGPDANATLQEWFEPNRFAAA
jgi:RNA polymerase sigma-70 factor (ECF subfamily)